MRLMFGGLAVLLGAVSISLAARYGYRQDHAGARGYAVPTGD